MDIERIKTGAAKIREGMDLMAGGPLDYYLEQLAASYELLITRFAPFKVGERVELAHTPEISEKVAWGWLSGKHYLKAGTVGTVQEVSCGKGGFSFLVSFDDESWIHPHTKERQPTPHEHHYGFKEHWLRPAASEN